MQVSDYGTMPVMLCCMCGVGIDSNPANMCVNCLREQVDITAELRTQLTMHSCRSCNRFLLPPWSNCGLESKELMSACLRKVPGLSKVKLIDAVWIWTEPHSLRLKIKLTVQKEVVHGAIMQQATIVDFMVRNQQCKSCEANYAQGAWHAIVQVRQRVTHKRTFLFLEQLLLKHNAHSECLRIVTFRDGIDFYFMSKQLAVKFIDFLESHVPITLKYARKLVSADHSDNVGNFKHNYIAVIPPICKDDLVMLDTKLARNLSDISPLCIIKTVGASIHVLDPFTCERQEVSMEKYRCNEFQSIMSSNQLIKFVVLSIEPFLAMNRPSSKKRGGVDRKMRLGEVTIAREKDLGVNDAQFTTITHLAHLLREGDLVLGYDLTTAAWALEEGASGSYGKDLPDIVLVRKFYANKKARKYDLRNLEVDESEERMNAKDKEALENDYENFLQEIDADKELRTNINLYKKGTHATNAKKKRLDSVSNAMDEDENDDDGELDEEEVRLEELLDGLAVNDDDKEEEGSSAVLLTQSQSENTPSIPFTTSEFDVSNYNMKDFKFT